MELSVEQEDELRSILAQHPIGISTDALFAKTDMFESRAAISLGVHAAKNQGWLYTKNGLHFLVTSTKDYVPSSALVSESVPVSEPVKPIVSTPVCLPFGELSRSKSLGAAALALFKWRAEPALTLDDLVEITGAKKTVLYAVMAKLVDLEYADKNDTDFRRPYFKWSGKFAYPFSKHLTTDDELLLYRNPTALAARFAPTPTVSPVSTAKPLVTDVSPASPITTAVEQEVPHTPELSASLDLGKFLTGSSLQAVPSVPHSNFALLVRQIDLEISQYRRQIEMLTTMRSLLIPEGSNV